MNKRMTIFFSFIFLFFYLDCSNPKSEASCKESCTKKQNICFVATMNTNSSTISPMNCELAKLYCDSHCIKTKSSSSGSSKSSSPSRSSGGSRSGGSGHSSSSGGHSSGGGSSGGGSSGGGSSGSSHSIEAGL